MGGVVVVREQSRLHGAPHGSGWAFFCVFYTLFGGLLRRVQLLFLLPTVLSRLILSRYVWSLHRHVSSASLLLCMVIFTEFIQRAWCLWRSKFGEFVGRHRSWGTTLLCIWGNKVVEYEYSDRG